MFGSAAAFSRLTSAAALAAAVLFASAAAAQPVVPRSIDSFTALIEQHRPDAARRERSLAALAEAPPAGAGAAELARFHHGRARVAEALGDMDRERRELELALPHAIEAKLPGSSELGGEIRIRSELARTLRQSGNQFTAIEMFEDILKRIGPRSGFNVGANVNIAFAQGNLGNFEAAQAALARADAAMGRLRRTAHPLDLPLFESGWRAGIEQARGYLFLVQGKPLDAERAHRTAIASAQEQIAARAMRLQKGLAAPSEEAVLRHLDSLRIDLGWALSRSGRFDEAEVEAYQALKSALDRVGRGSFIAGNAVRLLAHVLNEKGRYRDALILQEHALKMFAEAGMQAESRFVILARREHAGFLASNDRHAQAVAEYERVRADLAGNPALQQALAGGTLAWGIALTRTGRAAEAEPMLRELIGRTQKATGPGSVAVALQRGYLGIALAALGRRDAALAELRASIDALIGPKASYAEYASASPAGARRVTQILQAYIRLLAEIHAAGGRPGLDAVAEAFRLADAARGQSVQRAIAASGARAASNDPALAALIRREQDLQLERDALYRFLIEQLSAPPERELPKVQANMRARIDAIAREREALARDIERRFPRYAELVHPRATTLAEARAALHRGEALVSILVTPEASLVWAIPFEGAPAFAVAPLGAAEMGRMVARLRRALDGGEVPLSRLPAFDLDTAHALYAALLQPAEAALAGASSLLVVANGPLAQLPLALLPTAPFALARDAAPLFTAYRGVPWLVKRYAVTQLPSVNALATLRSLPPARADRAAFIGFGDPQFGPAPAAAGATRGARLRNLSVAHDAGEISAGSDSAAGKPGDWIPYSKLPPLPDTREEVLAIAAALHADPRQDVFLGAQASKHNLERLDLSNRRVVAFATHGLIPGDFPGLSQPALALAAPADGQGSGLLTLEDILALKLDADWVVLSACNTAAGEGAGAEAVSGLGRGFFYAGSRALLVTHWPVETVSAKKLVTGIFRSYAQGGVSRAGALRRSMLALMAEDDLDPATRRPRFAYAHPLFWGPYALVGDSGD